jgi:hypothetical protein
VEARANQPHADRLRGLKPSEADIPYGVYAPTERTLRALARAAAAGELLEVLDRSAKEYSAVPPEGKDPSLQSDSDDWLEDETIKL